MRFSAVIRIAGLALLLFAAVIAVAGKKTDIKSAIHSVPRASFADLHIPRLTQRPRLADFLSMKPASPFDREMLKVDGLKQRDPKDGAPVSQKTEVYLGYTEKNLYVVAVCFDDNIRGIRGRLVRREFINDDDQFGFVLDTFRDRKHAVFFYLNPRGVQQDGIWSDTDEPDYSYDVVWNSDGRITPQGYVVWFEIPFRSLRFPPVPEQTWGFFFERDIRRNNEDAFYPYISGNVQGFLTQEAEMSGLANVTPSRNFQINPYASLRTFRDIDHRDPYHPFFDSKDLEGRIGFDAKAVIKNALVLDATVNPDFAQVESDEPQITVNRRFEVYFPEKRPFFLENSSYFNTPIPLVFTRRIADPEYGVRLTGKLGRWSVATLFADDKSPGKSVPPGDPLFGTKAYYGVLRVNHDIGKSSSLGFIYTDREMNMAPDTICTDDPCISGSNRVGGVDGKFTFGSKWLASFQAVESLTKFNDGTNSSGPSYFGYLERSSRALEYNVLYQDTAPGFQTDTGFFRRPDIRRVSQFAQYRFRREGKILQWHGPALFTANNWDHDGIRLEWLVDASYRWTFAGQSNLGFYANLGHERLRPIDYDTLISNRDYAHRHEGMFFSFGHFKQVISGGEVDIGTSTNYDTAVGPPVLANASSAKLWFTVRPVSRLTVDHTYLFDRLTTLDGQTGIFNNHIIRSKWNYQFTRAFSLRLIGQYSSILANSSLTSLQTTKNFDADVLFTYLVHPGTAVYVGYNSNLQNLDRNLGVNPDGDLLHTPNGYLNDGRQFFVKVSYLWRY